MNATKWELFDQMDDMVCQVNVVYCGYERKLFIYIVCSRIALLSMSFSFKNNCYCQHTTWNASIHLTQTDICRCCWVYHSNIFYIIASKEMFLGNDKNADRLKQMVSSIHWKNKRMVLCSSVLYLHGNWSLISQSR